MQNQPSHYEALQPIGTWLPGNPAAAAHAEPPTFQLMLENLHRPVYAVFDGSGSALTQVGQARLGEFSQDPDAKALLGWAPALPPENLGDRAFCREYGLKYACLSGSMANAIASEELVETMARHGMMGFFGSAGLAAELVEQHITSLQNKLGELPFGCNLIHSPSDPELEAKLAQLFIAKAVHHLEASAFLSLTLPLLRYRYYGIKRNANGEIFTPNHVTAKVSRLEIAEKFLHPAPEKLLAQLVSEGFLTSEQASLAALVPVASAVTAEGDSGGHTDNRPTISLLPSIIALRNRLEASHGVHVPIGCAGGIATPASTAAAFAMGAAYVMTGSINQACQESGSCDYVRDLLLKAGPADIAMAPAADMFEMGVNVQVLKWGTMFPVKAKRLYELYRANPSFDTIAPEARKLIETTYLKATFAESWQATRAFFLKRDPRQVERAEKDPKHKMALVFRSYLGQASRWANAGDPERRPDYQIWCGPAMGAFNEWAKGTFLDSAKERRAANVALNLLAGACTLTRANTLRQQGVPLAAHLGNFVPRHDEELMRLLEP